MKRVGYLYEKIFTTENISKAIDNACRNKKDRKIVKKVLKNREKIIQFIKDNPDYVSNKKITPHYDKSSGKVRDVIAPDILYLIKQHAIIQIIYPYISRDFYYHSYGAIRGKGILKASMQLRRLTHHNRYAMKIDIVKYYDNVDIETLKSFVARKIKDKKVLEIISGILGDKEKGIPIGNYTSQILANVYLTRADNFIKQDLLQKDYIRQMDDMVFLGNNKRTLAKTIKQVEEFLLEKLKCKIHNERVRLIDLYKSFIDFCAYKHYKDGVVAIRKSIFNRIRHTIFTLMRYVYRKLARRLMAYYGYITHSNNRKILSYYFPKINFANLRVASRI